MANLRRLDAFAKPRHETRSTSAVGGIITVVAASTAALLFVAQLAMYIRGNPTHSLHLSHSQSIPILPLKMKSHTSQMIMLTAGKIPLRIHVTFPFLQCSQLEVKHDGASLSTGELEKIHGRHFLSLRTPTASELAKLGAHDRTKGCTVEGMMRVSRVGGQLSIVMNRKAWRDATMALMAGLREGPGGKSEHLKQYNVSHFIEHVRFGNTFERADNPLEHRAHVINNDFGGVALEEIDVKLVPTQQLSFFGIMESYQLSVNDHTVQPATMVDSKISQYPGLAITYDFTPLAVHYTSGRENFLVFFSSLISIVGGVFVTVGLVTGCVVHSAQAVSKKID
jgi:hypothetical protein